MTDDDLMTMFAHLDPEKLKDQLDKENRMNQELRDLAGSLVGISSDAEGLEQMGYIFDGMHWIKVK